MLTIINFLKIEARKKNGSTSGGTNSGRFTKLPARLAEWVSANFDPWLTDEEGTLLYRPDRYNTSQGKYVYIYFSRITGRRGHWCHCPLNGEDGHTDHCGDSIHPVLILKGKLDNVTQCRVANFSRSRDTRSKTFIIFPQSICVFLVL